MNKWLTPLVKIYRHHYGLTQKPVVWEVGSRDGNDCFEIAERIYDGDEAWFWANADLVAFEPNPAQARIIKRNYPEMRVIEKAASNQNGFAPFMVYHGDEGAVGSSSLDLYWKLGEEGHQIQVETVRLEPLIKNPIDVMKIDVEGHSVQVLEGMGDKVDKVKVFHIETEKWTGSYDKVKDMMKARGFLLMDESEQWGDMPDLVFVAPRKA